MPVNDDAAPDVQQLANLVVSMATVSLTTSDEREATGAISVLIEQGLAESPTDDLQFLARVVRVQAQMVASLVELLAKEQEADPVILLRSIALALQLSL